MALLHRSAARATWRVNRPCSSRWPSAWSGVRAVVDLRAVVDVEDVDGAGVLLDPVDDPVGAAPGCVTASQRAEQRLTDAVRVDREGGLAELQHGSGDRLGKPLRDGPPRGWLEPDLVALLWLGAHAPVARRRARACRTVSRSAAGSPRPSAARLSEMRATAWVSPRISRVISRPSRSSTETRTASGSPLRVRVIRSCCWRTRLASSDRRALASDSGTGVAAIVIVRCIGYVGQNSGQQTRGVAGGRDLRDAGVRNRCGGSAAGGLRAADGHGAAHQAGV